MKWNDKVTLVEMQAKLNHVGALIERLNRPQKEELRGLYLALANEVFRQFHLEV